MASEIALYEYVKLCPLKYILYARSYIPVLLL
jgi:hypothetical protein